MALKGRQPNMKEAHHLADVVELGCIVCLNQGFINPAEIHHTEGKTKKDCHFKVLPLCFEHHRKGGDKEPISRHPYKKRFETKYGTEQELLKQVGKLLKKQEEYGYLDDLPF